MNLRILAASVLAAGVVAAVAVLSQEPNRMPGVGRTPPRVSTTAPVVGTAAAGGPGAPAAPSTGPRDTPFQTAAECQSCHQPVFEEWKRSFHGQAWTDPMVQALSQGFRMPECIDCHAPIPLHVTGVGQRVAPRKHGRSDGVDCLSCHLMDDGVSVAATHAADTSKVPGACKPVLVEAMGKVDACAGCHNQHETVNELVNSGLQKTCADCHMETVDRGGHAGRSHLFPAGHDVGMLKRATKLELTVENGEVVARVTNVGGGHQIPTDARHRSFNLWISAWDGRGNQQVKDQHIGEMRLYYRQDFKESTQVAYGKSYVAKWRILDGLPKGKAVVRLTYALNPEELGAGRITDVQTAEVQLP